MTIPDAGGHAARLRLMSADLKWHNQNDTSCVSESSALVSWCGNHTSKFEKRPRVGKAVAARTPIPFRDLLLDIARSVREVAA